MEHSARGCFLPTFTPVSPWAGRQLVEADALPGAREAAQRAVAHPRALGLRHPLHVRVHLGLHARVAAPRGGVLAQRVGLLVESLVRVRVRVRVKVWASDPNPNQARARILTLASSYSAAQAGSSSARPARRSSASSSLPRPGSGSGLVLGLVRTLTLEPNPNPNLSSPTNLAVPARAEHEGALERRRAAAARDRLREQLLRLC